MNNSDDEQFEDTYESIAADEEEAIETLEVEDAAVIQSTMPGEDENKPPKPKPGGLPEVCRKSAGGLPEVCRRSAGSVPSSRTLKITNNYYQRKKKSNIHTLWARSAQPLFSVKFISCTRPLINWGGCGQTGTLCHPLHILCSPIW